MRCVLCVVNCESQNTYLKLICLLWIFRQYNKFLTHFHSFETSYGCWTLLYVVNSLKNHEICNNETNFITTFHTLFIGQSHIFFLYNIETFIAAERNGICS